MKLKQDNLELNSKTIGALPVINHFLKRLSVSEIFEKHVPSKSNMLFKHSEAITLFIRNILIERQPLYNLSDWAKQYLPDWLGLNELKPKILNDDRIGRSLNALFEADRATLMTDIVLKMMKEFKIDTSQFHNDSTSVTVTGDYHCPSNYQGKSTVKLTYGHNKDHRPDLKQLVYCLTVSQDGAVPVHYKVYDGNVTDDKTHINTWDNLRRITGINSFIYVADSKLCTREQMEYIAGEGGFFITVLPRKRKE